jgi:hypothetical protein
MAASAENIQSIWRNVNIGLGGGINAAWRWRRIKRNRKHRNDLPDISWQLGYRRQRWREKRKA